MTVGQVVGYARVSTTDQSTEIQEADLDKAGCIKVFVERVSGRSTEGRDQLALALDYVREGDTLVVTKIDRLARSITDLLRIVERLTTKGVAIKFLDQNIDTNGPMGKLMLAVIGSMAEFEADLRAERQAAGIAAAKVKGAYKGRKPTGQAKLDAVGQAIALGVPVTKACADQGISRATWYKHKA